MKKARPSAELARVMSKRGLCSRSEANAAVRAGKVTVNGRVVRDPFMAVGERDRIELEGAREGAAAVYILLNKPRGLVTTSADEHGRATVFECLAGSGLPRLIAVGRLDMASEGLLLLTNDTAWANRITDPATHLDKTYHVQINAVADERLLQMMRDGVEHEGERLGAKSARLLRSGQKNSWMEVVLDEGRNRHIRRMLAALGLEVMRLVRVAIGELELGNVEKGKWRALSKHEVEALKNPKAEIRSPKETRKPKSE